MIELLLTIALIGSIVLVVLIFASKRIPKQLNKSYFTKEWRYLQVMCGSKDTWPLAIINADKLLDTALKKRRFSGKTMGERLVSAQKKFTNNDSVWFAHKLRNRLVHEQDVSLREKDVKEALIGFRQALKDLGAL
ncbi:hypothetical protein EB118_02345 [bacterium]|nr:hypothetical protein [bacterium]NBX98450.1 hypothetical protein [bacterium]NDC94108.1 hypothetical protein [bacterium]NDD83351.1 hypothetical protein [bacterium]NDG28929.1 hypothetical protein [bacterium]